MKPHKFPHTIFLLFIIVIFNNCKGDFKLPYPLEKGTVLGKEVCHVTKDYWLVNFDKGYGDTLTFKGILYAHVVKTNQLDPLLKQVGMRVSLGFDISPDKIASSGCTITPSETYFLRTIELHSQAEQR